MSLAGLCEKSDLASLPKDRLPVTQLTVRAASSKALLEGQAQPNCEMSQLAASLAEMLIWGSSEEASWAVTDPPQGLLPQLWSKPNLVPHCWPQYFVKNIVVYFSKDFRLWAYLAFIYLCFYLSIHHPKQAGRKTIAHLTVFDPQLKCKIGEQSISVLYRCLIQGCDGVKVSMTTKQDRNCFSHKETNAGLLPGFESLPWLNIHIKNSKEKEDVGRII